MCLYAWVTVCTYIYLFFHKEGLEATLLGYTNSQILVSMLFSSKRNQVVREMTDSRKGIGSIYNEARVKTCEEVFRKTLQ